MAEYERSIVSTLRSRVAEERSFIQILIGPRQTGKTTALRQALSRQKLPYRFAQATIGDVSQDWLRAQWIQARSLVAGGAPALLVIDEVQLIAQWSGVVKELWDEDSWNKLDLRVVLTGSSSLLLQSGLSESLMGRFELIHCTHWTFAECRDAFGYSLDEYLFFGGYPGGAKLRADKQRWLDYIIDAVIEPSISNDVLALESVRKPALLRRLFYMGASYSAQEVSYRKLMGQLDDAGNATTIAHYLDLLDKAGLLNGLPKFDPKLLKQKNSSPRLMAYDTSLMVATYGTYRDFLLTDPERRGHLIETAVGAYLLARAKTDHFDVSWWRDGNAEVDFVLSQGDRVVGIEVKSGRIKGTKGITQFVNRFPHADIKVVGSQGCGIEQFLSGEVALFL